MGRPDLIDFDWLTTACGDRLHYAELSEEQRAILNDDAQIHHGDWPDLTPVRLSCGRSTGYVSIPGVFTRMGAMRCAGCCRATGMPAGKGSPKNDDACRVLLGMEPTYGTGGQR